MFDLDFWNLRLDKFDFVNLMLSFKNLSYKILIKAKLSLKVLLIII